MVTGDCRPGYSPDRTRPRSRPRCLAPRHGGGDREAPAGRGMERFAVEQIGVVLIQLGLPRRAATLRNLAGMRQWIESVNDTLEGSSTWNNAAPAPSSVSPVSLNAARPGRGDLTQPRINPPDKHSLINYYN
jgi:hypothetical protein